MFIGIILDWSILRPWIAAFSAFSIFSLRFFNEHIFMFFGFAFFFFLLSRSATEASLINNNYLPSHSSTVMTGMPAGILPGIGTVFF